MTRIILNIPDPDHDPLEAGGFTWSHYVRDDSIERFNAGGVDMICFESQDYGRIETSCQYVVIESSEVKSDC